MQKAIIGKKIGMSQMFLENGTVVPLTVVEVGPCVVSQKKTTQNDGYEAVQIGFGDIYANKLNKPQRGHFAKTDTPPKRVLKEFRLADSSNLDVGAVIKADVFSEGELVDITATSKGKGYAGVIKRFGAHSLKASHGTGPNARHAGSNGGCSSPSKVFKGKKLPGQMGNTTVTVQNLTIVKVDAENNLLAVKGAVPGPKGGIIYIKDSVKKQPNTQKKAKA